MNEDITDIIGNFIGVGDSVAYPTRKGSYLTMTTGDVEAIVAGKLKIRRRTEKHNFSVTPHYFGESPLVTVSPILAVLL